ncbi:hypothetical protein C8F04DRAFT_1139078 [Mycena alexandri]|uniref:C3H1-type domain-containing protein n=1 Tax=Mycena alexandri TaxID=1745969 RepID=A0AAD6S6I9_9AGAR|nr:hypothetical protein C8F04DRAFT_1139078 [Mycena alexandri]
MASEAQIKSEIARLTASISQHKSKSATANSTRYQPPRSSTYINPNYKPPANKYIRPPPSKPPPQSRPPTASSSTQVKEVVLNGVAFESSNRSLVRKDLPKPPASKSKPPSAAPPPRHTKHFPAPRPRVYKPKSRRRGGPVNMTLTNSRRPYQARPKRPKSDKPCPRFSTTGTCAHARTCPYTHDPATTAICWPFLSGSCPLSAEQCALSHDPTPERTPLCTHFLAGSSCFHLFLSSLMYPSPYFLLPSLNHRATVPGARCTRPACPFPHVNVGPRSGVCRAFAVLGYCKLGLDCPQAHVRECPDFAEKGECTRPGCKLPHVIRANGAKGRKIPTTTTATTSTTLPVAAAPMKIDATTPTTPAPTAEDAQLGDEFISLTFNESSEEDDDESDEDESGSDSDGSNSNGEEVDEDGEQEGGGEMGGGD